VEKPREFFGFSMASGLCIEDERNRRGKRWGSSRYTFFNSNK